MTALDRIAGDAAARGETLAQAVRHHVMIGVVARLARCTGGEAFVLRGGLLTRAWVAPRSRPTRDLDFVGDFPFDIDDTVHRFAPALRIELDDDVRIDADRLGARGMWLDTAFPGVHLTLAVGLGGVDQELGVDIGFADPLVPATTTIELGATRVRAVRPETQVAWKLHAIAEMGASWRPKDLADLWSITGAVALVEDDLVAAIAAAFESRGYTRAQAVAALADPHWATKTARVRWATQRATHELASVIGDVRERLAGALARLHTGSP